MTLNSIQKYGNSIYFIENFENCTGASWTLVMCSLRKTHIILTPTEYVELLKLGNIKLLDLLMKFGVASVDIQGDTVCFCHSLYDGKTLPLENVCLLSPQCGSTTHQTPKS